uniref:Uncharacterized protein n=1 Tax=Helianthus annuus TaxID=4232 RepID=A0A251T509_HELAN
MFKVMIILRKNHYCLVCILVSLSLLFSGKHGDETTNAGDQIGDLVNLASMLRFLSTLSLILTKVS